MKTNKENIDELIREALSEEEAKFYDELDEQNLFEMVGGLFTGKLKWIMVLMNVVMFLVFILFIYCVIQFLKAEDTVMLIKWTAGGILCLNAVTLLKLFDWMQINKNVLLREIKRLELQLSSLAYKMDK
ncbi:MAG: hypothetical protein HKN00_05590 [Flavobacteriaceae bacterium]|nr:hypothetical protein [Bacteroidia bacterium]MBT8287755.1 hypothetical protein [Bacteroidia bacterium]NNF74635.1 hypothetical protein [Flavobacteriaceae bacterium]NNK71879.1 hypothetical protein [Flavobacteriaceae bacterium]